MYTNFLNEYKNNCPNNLIYKNLGNIVIDGYQTARMLTTCLEASNNTPTGLKKGQSEVIYTMITIAKNDVYILKKMLRSKKIDAKKLPFTKLNAELMIMDFLPISICSLAGKQVDCIKEKTYE